MLSNNLILKRGELFTAGTIETDGSREQAAGLYMRDTRHLSAFEIALDGTAPEVLSVVQHDASTATVLYSNRLIERVDGDFSPQQVLITAAVSIDRSLTVALSIRNYAHKPIAIDLELFFAADFRDLFDIRGFHRSRRGRWFPPKADAGGIELGYTGLDDRRAGTRIVFDNPCTITPRSFVSDARDGSFLYLMGTEPSNMQHELHDVPGASAVFPLELQPNDQNIVTVVITPLPATPWVAAELPVRPAARISTDNADLNQLLDQSGRDLDALQTPFPQGALPAAGIPWFVAPFGRDSLITGLQTFRFAPDRAEGTVRILAALQGQRHDPAREEAPGKILHEMRYGEMARLGEVPHSPYYGSVDATPLWLWLLAEIVIWTGNQSLLEELLPNVVAALEWIERDGDIDGDGLIEYGDEIPGLAYIKHQVWKDSHDSLNHADGTPATGPIAAVEVQGYAFAAYSRLAAALPTESSLSRDLIERAGRIRRSIEDRFWIEDEGTYAQALDGAGRQVGVVSSNGGQLLACGVPSPERAARVAARLSAADMHGGWGIRTLSTNAATYNPMSYHNGSVWPHDNSLIGSGFYRYGQATAGHAVTTTLLEAAQTMDLYRLPELYCGFPREGIAREMPVRYPVSCSPQAWSSGSILLLLAGMLGLGVDPVTGRICVDPDLPDWLNEVRIDDLRVLGHHGTLVVRRTGSAYVIETEGLPEIEVAHRDEGGRRR